MQSTNLREGGQIYRNSQAFTSRVLADFVVIQCTWRNNMLACWMEATKAGFLTYLFATQTYFSQL